MIRFTYILLVFILVSCHSNDSALMDLGPTSGQFEEMQDIPATEQPAPEEVADQVEEPTQKIIRRGGIDFRSKDLEGDYARIRELTTAFRGFTESENQSSSPRQKGYHLTIRVPAESYDSLLSAIAALAYVVDNRYSNREDVTGAYYDLQASIKNKRALEERYLQLLKEVDNVKDILEIERALTEVRTDIDRLEGRFSFLGNQIGLSTLQVYLYETLPFSFAAYRQEAFFPSIREAMARGWLGFLSFLVWVVRIWPFVILAALGVYVWRRRRAKRKALSSNK